MCTSRCLKLNFGGQRRRSSTTIAVASPAVVICLNSLLLSRLLKPQTKKTTEPPGVFFSISIAQLSVELDDTIMSKVAKDNEKTRGKNGKTEKRSEEPDNDQYTAFKITTRGYCLRFCIKAVTCIKKRKSRLKSFLANFVGNLDARVELRQYQSLSQSNFFLFLRWGFT